MSDERLLMRGKFGPGPSYQWRQPSDADVFAAACRLPGARLVKMRPKDRAGWESPMPVVHLIVPDPSVEVSS